MNRHLPIHSAKIALIADKSKENPKKFIDRLHFCHYGDNNNFQECRTRTDGAEPTEHDRRRHRLRTK